MEEVSDTSREQPDMSIFEPGVEDSVKRIVSFRSGEDDVPLIPHRRIRSQGEPSSSRPDRTSNVAAAGANPRRRGDKAMRIKFPRLSSVVVCMNPYGELNIDGLLPTCGSKLVATNIRELRRKWEIPESVEIMISAPEHAFYNPPVGYICVHEVVVQCGWRLPISPELKDILNYIGIGPSQVIPN